MNKVSIENTTRFSEANDSQGKELAELKAKYAKIQDDMADLRSQWETKQASLENVSQTILEGHKKMLAKAKKERDSAVRESIALRRTFMTMGSVMILVSLAALVLGVWTQLTPQPTPTVVISQPPEVEPKDPVPTDPDTPETLSITLQDLQGLLEQILGPMMDQISEKVLAHPIFQGEPIKAEAPPTKGEEQRTSTHKRGLAQKILSQILGKMPKEDQHSPDRRHSSFSRSSGQRVVQNAMEGIFEALNRHR
jgi:hypothetical protein